MNYNKFSPSDVPVGTVACLSSRPTVCHLYINCQPYDYRTDTVITIQKILLHGKIE